MQRKDGGPAFPGEYAITIPHPEGGDETHLAHGYGMSLRDYFAANALMGSVGNSNIGIGDPGQHAKWAYEYADAMLAEREKTDA